MIQKYTKHKDKLAHLSFQLELTTQHCLLFCDWPVTHPAVENPLRGWY